MQRVERNLRNQKSTIISPDHVERVRLVWIPAVASAALWKEFEEGLRSD